MDDNSLKEDVREMKKDLKDLRENHVFHIETNVAKISTNQDWLMKFFWIIATSSVGGLVTGIVNLMR